MARIDVAAEQQILFGRRHRCDALGGYIAIAGEDARKAAGGLEIRHDNSRRDAGMAAFAIGHVGNVL